MINTPAQASITKQMTRMNRMAAMRTGDANLISFIMLFPLLLSSPDDAQYQCNEREHDQHMDQAAYTINEYPQEPAYDQYNCYQIK